MRLAFVIVTLFAVVVATASSCDGDAAFLSAGVGEHSVERGSEVCFEGGLGPGDGLLTATDANLTYDPSNAACTSSDGVNACVTKAGALPCFEFDVTVAGNHVAAIEQNRAHWIDFVAIPYESAFLFHACEGSAVQCFYDALNDATICTCGLCLATAPTELAVAVNDGTSTSNGICAYVQ
jgi:hypothetical protein